MSEFYQGIGQYLPATYAVEGMTNLVLGGNGIGRDVFFLAAIGVTTLTLGALSIWIRRSGPAISESHREKQIATVPSSLEASVSSSDH
ncbi:hypothetical protein Q0F98_19610 [Paenibacillus amylolyticus]|nr:hypothetical protein Q0F98_19610 [Paenibacillus amylolyticus]